MCSARLECYEYDSSILRVTSLPAVTRLPCTPSATTTPNRAESVPTSRCWRMTAWQLLVMQWTGSIVTNSSTWVHTQTTVSPLTQNWIFTGFALFRHRYFNSSQKRDIIQEASTFPALFRSKYNHEFVLQQMYRRVTLMYATEGNIAWLDKTNQIRNVRPNKSECINGDVILWRMPCLKFSPSLKPTFFLPRTAIWTNPLSVLFLLMLLPPPAPPPPPKSD